MGVAVESDAKTLPSQLRRALAAGRRRLLTRLAGAVLFVVASTTSSHGWAGGVTPKDPLVLSPSATAAFLRGSRSTSGLLRLPDRGACRCASAVRRPVAL